MSNFEMRDDVSNELFLVEQLMKQLIINHTDIHVKDEENMTKLEQYGYARLYSCNSTLIDIVFEKIRHAKELIDKMAI